MRHDRRSLLEQHALDQDAAIANELEHGYESLKAVAHGLKRFRSGTGRHGRFDDIA